MRAIIAGLAGTIFATNAMAADYLRGSTYEGGPVGYNWAGVYIGAQIGYSEAGVDPSGATRDVVAHLLRLTTIEEEAQVSGWPSLPRRDVRATSYGGFVGYNSQWGDIVLGTELNYSRTSLPAASTDTISRRFTTSDNIQYDVDVISSASMKVTDYGTARVRVGYAWNWVLPYVHGGLAIGRADISRSATIVMDRNDLSTTPSTPLGIITYADADTQNGAFTFGYSAGVGVDIGLFPGVFVRGEYEFIQLNTLKGITTHLNTFRVAAALKF
jgi:opacity protein-like surface antigen